MSNRMAEILSLLLWGFAVVVLLSLATFHISDFDALGKQPMHNILGPFGAVLAQALRISFGISSYLIIPILVLAGWGLLKFRSLEAVLEHLFAVAFCMVSSTLLASLLLPHSMLAVSGGVVGSALLYVLKTIMGAVGAWIAAILLIIVSLILLGVISISHLLSSVSFSSLTQAASKLYTRAVLFKQKNSLPLINIESFNHDKKMPWITRTKIIIYNKARQKKPKLISYDAAFAGIHENTVYQDHDVFSNASIIDTRTMHADADDLHSAPIIETQASAVDVLRKENTLSLTTAVYDVPQAEEYPESASTPDYEPDNQAYNPPAVIADDVCRNAEDEDDSPQLDQADMVSRNIFEEIPVNRYSLPVDFLKQYTAHDETGYKQEVAKNSELLTNTLNDFGIESKVINVNRGPVITLYELQIAPGIKVNRIVGLADDIAMALAASRVRVVAPIPGKKAIGVEIPNKTRETVTFKDIITSSEYAHQQGRLKVGLGKDIMGKPVIIDLKKLPHLLIAGATGAGKSVCVHSIITSLVYNYDPNHVRFIMVDPKLVELQIYNGIPHLLTPVIIEPFMVPKALKWTMLEMERRYYLLSEFNTRDIDRYNHLIERGNGEYLPYIVIIMDELADLMMVAAKEIEGYITRIAQKARAVGIHLVLATQRPSVDIITGIIKANFPARIAFQVAQKTDSRTIIDQNGAEKLLGKGDMLYQSPMSSFPIRIQGAYISEDELSSVVSFLKNIAQPRYIDIDQRLVECEDEDEEGEDDLFIEAVKIVETTKKASASYLQRRLSIGYNRAARIIERMEELGYIGSQQGAKPRDVYI